MRAYVFISRSSPDNFKMVSPVTNAHFSWNVFLIIYRYFQVLDHLISLYLGWCFFTSRTRRAYLNAVSTTWSLAGKCRSWTVFEIMKKLRFCIFVSLWGIVPLGGAISFGKAISTASFPAQTFFSLEHSLCHPPLPHSFYPPFLHSPPSVHLSLPLSLSLFLVMHQSMSSPKGVGLSSGWGFWHFLNYQNPHPRAKVVVKSISSKWFISFLLLVIERSNYQNPHPGDRRQSETPWAYPWVVQPSPPWHG